MDKKNQLQWLLNNADKLEICGIHPDGYTGTPTLLIEFRNWEEAEKSPFESRNSCLMFE